MPFAVTFLLTGAIRLAAGSHRGRLLAGAAVVVGFLVAYFTIVGIPPFPPRGSDQKLVYAVAGGVLIGAILDRARLPRSVSPTAVTLACLGGLGWLALPLLRSIELGTTVLVVSIGVGSTVALLRLYRIRERGADASVMLGIAGLGASPVAFYGASLSLAQLCGALAASSAGFLLWNWPISRFPLGTQGVLGAGGALALLVATMGFYTDASRLGLALLLPVFFADTLANRVRVPRGTLGSALRPIILAAICAVPGAAAIAVARFVASSNLSGGYY